MTVVGEEAEAEAVDDATTRKENKAFEAKNSVKNSPPKSIPAEGNETFAPTEERSTSAVVFRSVADEKPRQILTSLVLFGCVLLPLSRYHMGGDDNPTETIAEGDIRAALFCVLSAFLTFAFLQTRDLILTRPHPGFWRLVFGCAAFYSFFMVFVLLMPTRSNARRVFAFLFSDLGDLDEYQRKIRIQIDSVMGSCEISGSALFRQVFWTPWVLSHSFGYLGKMLIFRDWRVAFLAGLLFELCEVTFMYFIPEFEECWWDSFFLDALGGNVLGVVAGHFVNSWIYQKGEQKEGEGADGDERDDASEASITGIARFNWLGKHERRTMSSQLLCTVSPFSSRYEYKIFSSPTRLFQVGVMVVLMAMLETNQFLLNNTVGVPNKSVFVPIRLAFLVAVGVPAGAEWYSYVLECDGQSSMNMTDDNRMPVTIRIGPSCWVLFWVAMVELAVVTKFFPSHMSIEIEKAGDVLGIPHHILLSYLASFFILFVWFQLRYKIVGYNKLKIDSGDSQIVQQILESSGSSKGWTHFSMLPRYLKRRVAVHEATDILLLLASLPMLYLFRVGWKWI